MTELKYRGVEDVLGAVVDGLKGFPDAITAVFPQATIQTCIVHLLRYSLDFVSWKDRKPVADRAQGHLSGARRRGRRGGVQLLRRGFLGPELPTNSRSWRRAWGEVIPFYAISPATRPRRICSSWSCDRCAAPVLCR
jgi:putative transposase